MKSWLFSPEAFGKSQDARRWIIQQFDREPHTVSGYHKFNKPTLLIRAAVEDGKVGGFECVIFDPTKLRREEGRKREEKDRIDAAGTAKDRERARSMQLR